MSRIKHSGFSLVELSIVLVIIGLLAGGIMAGQSLVRAAELRSVLTEAEEYKSAILKFQDAYYALPGDMPDAEDVWGTAATCPGDADDARTTEATCNGDGDGVIETWHATDAPDSNEIFGLWQHLANAQLIDGSFPGVTSNTAQPASTWFTIGTTIPQSEISADAGWFIYAPCTVTCDETSTVYFENTSGHMIALGKQNTVGIDSTASGAVLRPEEMWNLDKKVDDAMPGTGDIVTYERLTSCYILADGSAGSTSNAATRIDSTYNLESEEIVCAPAFRGAF